MCVEIIEKIHKKEIADYFDEDSVYWSKVYKDSGETNGFISYEMVERKRILLDLFHKNLTTSDNYILDCGCGTSVLLPELINNGSGLYGIDISFNQLAFAKEGLKNKISNDQINKISLILSDIEILPFKNNYFNVIFCVGVLQYLLKDEYAVKELSRVTKPGGYVFITLPNLFKLNSILDPYYYFNRGLRFLKVRLFGKKNRENINITSEFSDNANFLNRRYYYGQLNSLFSSSGLKIVAAKSVSFGEFTFLGKNLFGKETSIKISNFLQKMSDKKYLSMLNIFANRWIFCLRKI